MFKNRVSYCYCEEYNLEKVQTAVERIFSSFPELNNKLNSKPGLNILVKPNLLAPRHPDKAVTTHPVVLQAIINYLAKYDCKITIADSPAGPYNQKIMERLYKTCQIDTLGSDFVSLNYDLTDVMVNFPEGKVLKKSLIIKPAVEADFIINVPKLKTHTLARLTCATKNLFGLMPGVLKYRQHVAMPDLKIFAEMLIDINKYYEGRIFHIVDGIIGMEGEGPSGGDPKFAGALFGGWDSGFVDVLACEIMGMPIETVPTLMNYKGISKLDLVCFDGLKRQKFKLPPERYRSIPDNIPLWVQNIITELLIPKPLINRKTCVKCNICVESCPAEIITMQKNGAHISSYKDCIKCYCCQEACPHKSIHLSKPIIEQCFRLFRQFKR